MNDETFRHIYYHSYRHIRIYWMINQSAIITLEVPALTRSAFRSDLRWEGGSSRMTETDAAVCIQTVFNKLTHEL